MSVCEYCGEKAGWFQSSHTACVERAGRVNTTVRELVFRQILEGKNHAEIDASVRQELADAKTPYKYVRESLLQSVNDVVSKIALQSPVTKDDFDRLQMMVGPDGFDMAAHKAEYVAKQWFGPARLSMSLILGEVLRGNIATFFDDPVAFIVRSGETAILQTGDCVTYAEQRTISNHARSFGGLSVPLGRGIYYHFGGSQGHQERTSGLMPLDGGKMLITSDALYFGGQQTTLRIPLDHVLRYQPYVDGVGVFEAHGAPKVFTFNYQGMEVGWFFYNLLLALTRR